MELKNLDWKLISVFGLLVVVAGLAGALLSDNEFETNASVNLHPLIEAEQTRLLGLKAGHEVEAETALMVFEAYSMELAEYDSFLSKHDLGDYPAVEFALWQARDEVEFKAMDAEGWAFHNQEQADYYQEQLTGLSEWTGK